MQFVVVHPWRPGTARSCFSGLLQSLRLSSQLMAEDVVMVCSAALVLSFLATLYPAWRAARTQPAEALRYE